MDEQVETCIDDENMRGHKICPFKCSKEHPLRKCEKFKEYKNSCTKHYYCSKRFLYYDLVGFCAAAVYIRCGDYVLFLKEKRNKKIKYNLPGGGRETKILTDGTIRAETPYETAAEEFSEEVGDLILMGVNNTYLTKIKQMILNKDHDQVRWFGEFKYAVVILTIDEETARGLQPLDSSKISSTSEALSFEWLHVSQLHKRSLFHGFANDILTKINI
jgi:8-oxo-dGTP pyrophosphatase MutT (NUDIX family)